MAWQIPPRDAVLPVSSEQSCAVCGTVDWAWLYLLLTAPEWVQQLGWFANWFLVMCSPCHCNWAAGDRARLEAVWAPSLTWALCLSPHCVPQASL